jgi:hypothetical protein
MKYAWFCLLCLVLFGCEKDVDFDLDDAGPKLVVEGTIEAGQPPVVILTRSLSYFSTITPEQLTGSFVHQAEVTISNGSLSHRLKEYAVPLTPTVSLYYYSIDSSSLSTAFTGQVNTNYSLSIVSGGQTYTAVTRIPDTTKRIDSVWWKLPPGNSTDTSRVIVMVKATDRPGYGDYVRYYTSKNAEPFFPGLNSVFDDLFIDGTTYELQVEPGWDRNLDREEDDLFFHKGDTVTLKLSAIDRATYDFWRTMEFSYASVGNPFSTPVKVLSNIRGNALGYFGGYASQYRTIIIPR